MDIEMRLLKTTFQKNMVKKMKKDGVTAMELAKRIGFHRNNIYRLLYAPNHPSALTVLKVADALGVKPTDLTE